MKNILFCAILLLFFSCNNKTTEEGIMIGNDATVELADWIDSAHLTPLGMKEEYVIGGINKIAVVDSLYYLLDAGKTNSLYVFDTMGNPITKFGSIGRGPSEYLSIYDFDVDYDHKKIVILCEPQKIFVTDLDLNLQKIISLKEHAERIACWENTIYLYSHEDRSLKILDSLLHTTNNILIEQNFSNNYFRSLPVFHEMDGEMYYNSVGSDVVYRIENRKALKVFTLNYQNKNQKLRKWKANNDLSVSEKLLCSPPSIHSMFKFQNRYGIIYTYEALVRICFFDPGSVKTIKDGIMIYGNNNLEIRPDKKSLLTWAFMLERKIPIDSSKINISVKVPFYQDAEANPVLMRLFLK